MGSFPETNNDPRVSKKMIEVILFPRFYGMKQLWVSDLGCVRVMEVSVKKNLTLCPVGRKERNSTAFHTGRIRLEDQPPYPYIPFLT